MRGSRKAYHARQVFFLCLAVLLLAAQAGDGALDLRIRAGICEDAKCNRLTHVGLEPARVYVFVVIPQHRENRVLVYGVVCDAVEISRSLASLDGDADGPAFTREYRDIPAGDCVAVAILERSDGSRQTARSGLMRVMERG